MARKTILKAGWCLLSFLLFNGLRPSLGKKGRTFLRPTVLVVSFDGFRNDYLAKGQTPTFEAIRKSGVSVPYMEPVFPTNTAPNYQSIATGLYPETHGVVDNNPWDPKLGKRLDYRKPEIWNYHPDVLPIWIRNEMAGGISACMAWPGSNQKYGKNHDLLPTYFHSGARVGWNARVDKVVSWITNSSKPANLAFIYNDSPDGTAHKYGPNSKKLLEGLRTVDKQMAYLVRKLKQAGIFNKVNLIIVSDHGSEGVSKKRVIKTGKIIDSRLVEQKIGSGTSLQLKPKRGKGEELYRKLKEDSRHLNFSVYKKSDLKGYPWRYSSSRRILDYVLVADLGWIFDGASPGGVHGYPIWHKSMRPLFIARGPALKKGWKGRRPIRNVDVVPLITGILRLKGIHYNGSWGRVKDMLRPGYLQKIKNYRIT